MNPAAQTILGTKPPPSWAPPVCAFLSFGAAVGAGLAFGAWAQPDGDFAAGIQVFALLSVFVGGMAAWGAIAASIMARTFFNGDLVVALLRFLLRGRRREDLPRIETRPEVIMAAARRVFGWARIFPMLGAAVACVAAPVVTLVSERGILAVATASATLLVAYGMALCHLARRGYLMPPDLE